MPAAIPGAPSNPFMQQQKLMMYLFPVMFGVFGINFPVGVLLYWLVSNFWSMGQQLYVIRRMPAVGSPAYEAMMKRKGKAGGDNTIQGEVVDSGSSGGGSNGAVPGGAGAGGKPAARQQPKNQPRRQRSSPKKR
jgi:YidC/Oxa1 family membrane protein insertase